MQKGKQGVEIKPLAPPSVWDTLIPIAIAFLIGGIGAYLNKGQIAFCLAFLFGSIALIFLRNRRVDPEARQRNWLMFLPASLGLAFSFYPFASYFPALIGFGITGLVVMWFTVLQYPPELLSATKSFQAGETLKALQWVNLAIEKSPHSPDAYQFRSLVYLTLFKFSEAEQDARAALNLKPDNHTAMQNLGNALIFQDRLVEANDVISKALQIAPVYALYHHQKGLVCYRLGEFENAASFFQVALKGLIPFAQLYLTGYYYLANSLLRLGKTEEAQQTLVAMRQYAQEYPKLVARYRDAPDYPAIVQIRAELDEIGKYLA